MKLDTSAFGWLKAVGYAIVGFYTWIESVGINAYVLSILLLFMILDMILGVVKSHTVTGLKPSSDVAKKGVLTKMIMFIIPVVSGFIWSVFDKDDALKIINLQLTALMVAEGYSNIANAYAIHTGELLTEFDAVSFVFKKVAQKIKGLLEKIMK